MVHNQMIATNIIHPPVQLKKKKRLWKVKMIFFGLSKLLHHLPVSTLQFNFVAHIEYSTPATNSNR